MDRNQIEALRQLNNRDMAIFLSETNRLRKSTGFTYVLWFFFGPLGIHKFYLGSWTGFLNLGCLALIGMYFLLLIKSIGTMTLPSGMGIPAALAALFLALSLVADLFTIPLQVRWANETIAWQVLQNLSGVDSEDEDENEDEAEDGDEEEEEGESVHEPGKVKSGGDR